MNKTKTHRDLDVYRMSMDFVIELYELTGQFPKEERFGLVMQIRRAGVSVCSNIAEGAARTHEKEFIQFLYISLGSLSEIETQLVIAQRLKYISTISTQEKTIFRIRMMLLGLIRSVTRRRDEKV